MPSIYTQSLDRWKVERKHLPPGCLNLITPSAATVLDFEDSCRYNSIWDMLVTSRERLFFSLCAELSVSESAIFCEYHPATNRVTRHFNASRECLVPERAIPPSKFHTGMCEMADGVIIMSTHTTSRAPSHPAWLLDGYWGHPYEGYVGSNLLTFDPRNGDVRNLGVPVLRDSIYGGVYHAATHSYYFSTYLRGHIYHFDCETRKVTDLGQASEVGAYRLLPAADRHIYGLSRSGWVFRINTKRRRLEDTGGYVPPDPHSMSKMHRLEQAFAAGPDGRLYVGLHFHNNIFAFDVGRKALVPVGNYDPFPEGTGNLYRTIWGMQFDDRGVLWYTVSTQLPTVGLFSHLCRWDITRGGSPEFMGCVGTPERIAGTVSEIAWCKGRLIIADTNHGDDPPRLVQIETSRLTTGGEALPLSDPHTAYFINGGHSLFQRAGTRKARRPAAFANSIVRSFTVLERNSPTLPTRSLEAIRLWREVAPEDSCVHSIRWISGTTLRGWCGKQTHYCFEICDGKLLRLDQVREPILPISRRVPRIAQRRLELVPGRAGRQYLNRITAWVPWHGGAFLSGTADGCLALFRKSVRVPYSIGAVSTCGAVHDLSTNRSRTIAYGVMGDPDDLGMVFRYDEVNGLRELGRIKFQDTKPPWIVSSSQPSCVATHPTEDVVAIGTCDRMGCIYVAFGVGSAARLSNRL